MAGFFDTFDWKEYLEKQVEFYKKEIEFDDKQIKWANQDIQRERERDRSLYEYVWSKGVLTEWEHRYYGMPMKQFKSSTTQKYMNDRARYYRHKKKDIKKLEYYKKQLEEYKG